MSIDADKQKYFWLAANDTVTPTEPEPATYAASKVTPLIDLYEYMEKFRAALDLVGTDPDPANNRGDFIYIMGWWLGLMSGEFRGSFFSGPSVSDLSGFDLDPLGPDVRLIDVLKAKAQAGVDVRVMGWISFSLLSTTPLRIPLLGALINPIASAAIASIDPGGMVGLNGQTMNSVKAVRAEPTMAKGGMLNVIGHSAGAVHIKGAIVGTKPGGDGKTKAIAFTGGLDMVENRWAKWRHLIDPTWDSDPSIPLWHDVEAAVEGPAAQGIYNHFRDMWNENLRREAKKFNFEGERMPSYVAGTTAVTDRTIEPLLLPSADPLQHHVQSLRTIPAFKYRWYNCLPENPPVSYAPEGLFEIKAAWKKAILGATRYIYMEDQMYWGREIMEWVNTAIRANPQLRVILAMSGQSDPNDAAFDDSKILHDSINVGLFGIGTANELTTAQRNQVRAFRLWTDPVVTNDNLTVTNVTTESPAVFLAETNLRLDVTVREIPENAYARANAMLTNGLLSWAITGNKKCMPGEQLVLRVSSASGPLATGTFQMWLMIGLVVHSKTTLVDDKWALIGSANVARRSLYTDWEHSVAFIDEAGTSVQDFRARLWAEHFQRPLYFDFLDVDEALGGWSDDAAWRTTASFPTPQDRPLGVPGPPYLQPVPLPLANNPMTPEIRTKLDELRDVDSRQDWGGVCPPTS